MEEQKGHRQIPLMEGLIKVSPLNGPPRLIGGKCSNCGRKFFPKRTICPECFSDEKMEETLFGPYGKIYAFTTVRIPAPLGFEVPYTYGYVDLPEDDVRVPAMFTREKSDQLRIGMGVRLVIEKLRTDKEGNEIIGYKFKPVEE